MLDESFFLIPCDRFLAFLARLDIHTSLYEERILTTVVRLALGGTRMTIFHCRIRIAVTGLPVLGRRHIIAEGRTEELRPVDFLLTRFEVELDIVRVSQSEIALLGFVLLRVLPTFGIRP